MNKIVLNETQKNTEILQTVISYGNLTNSFIITHRLRGHFCKRIQRTIIIIALCRFPERKRVRKEEKRNVPYYLSFIS